MDKAQSLELAQQTVDSIAKRGITECKVSIYEMEESKLSWRAGRLEETSGSSRTSLTVSLFREGKFTNQGTSDLRPAELERFLDDAAAFLELMPPDQWRSMPDPKLQWAVDFDPCNSEPTFGSRSLASRKDAVQALYDRTRELDSAIVESDCWTYENHDINTFLYSTGFSSQLEQTWLDLGCVVTMLAPDGTRPSAWYGTPCRLASRLGNPEEIAQEAVKRCRIQFGQSKAPSGTYDIVLRNENASWILGPLMNGISGWAIDQKSTMYEGKRGQLVASPLLTLRDDPFLEGGYNRRACDWEGFPSRRRDILYKGVLQDYLVDWYYSRKLGLLPTTGSTSNLIIEPGTWSLDELIAGMDKGILIYGFNGGNDNAVTGDFSVGISGLLVEQGKIVRPVNEMLMSGNFKDFLASLDGVGNDPWDRSSALTPSLRFRNVKVAGL